MPGAPHRQRRRPAITPFRIVTAVPLCDGHDSAIMTINQELVRHGAEVIYLGYHQSASAIARAAVQEDADAIGLSSYNGGHVAFFREVVRQLGRRGAPEIKVFGGGGGTMAPADERVMQRFGVERVFFAGTPLDTIVRTVLACRVRKPAKSFKHGDRALARMITRAESSPASGRSAPNRRGGKPALASGRSFVVGLAGPGGAGKSTLIDELTSRFLRENPRGRLAILANDPSHANSGGALLGDRVSAVYAQDDRVFFRSLATRGSLTGISAATPAAIATLRRSGQFDLILVESVGIGQENDPFGALGGTETGIADAVVFVLSPHYGGRVQLDKIALLDAVDLVVLNKSDDARISAARAELAARLRGLPQPPPVLLTTAAQHQDAGVDRLYAALAELAAFEARGGERTCQLRVHE